MKGFSSLFLPLVLYVFCSPAFAQSCSVSYSITNSWPGGFQAALAITNKGTTAINGWTLQWQFTGNQQINNLWGGTVSQQGQNVTVTNLSWDANIPAGGTMNSVGFVANSSGANTVP